MTPGVRDLAPAGADSAHGDHHADEAVEHGHDHHGHDHDHVEPGPLELNPIWQQDHVTLHSVGVDIGSSGTQVVFSRLVLRRRGESLTSRYVVEERAQLFASEVHLTPYTDDLRIDAVRLGELLDAAYAEARLTPERIDTGVVILTGEALRRHNAELIASVVAERAGDLVCATAGHHMEATLAAYGSGAARLSHDLGGRVLNVDIGGGTTKLSLLDHGRLKGTAALHVGGRLQVVEDGRITRLEPAGHLHALAAGYDRQLGDSVEPGELEAIAEVMAQAILNGVGPDPDVVRHLFLTEPITDLAELQGVVLSGGVGEFFYGRENRDFGDLGRLLGQALARRAGELPGPVLEATERIRATVLGASEYTVQLSGITSHTGAADRLLPRRNLQVVRPAVPTGEFVDSAAVGDAVTAHLRNFGLSVVDDDFALALAWDGAPAYPRLRALAEGVLRAVVDRLAARRPLYLIVDADIARTLGGILERELGVQSDLLILDGVELRDFDFVDLGRVRQPSGTVPVTIKSLVFATEPIE
jgi:ethanolamine utilization protein EutA